MQIINITNYKDEGLKTKVLLFSIILLCSVTLLFAGDYSLVRTTVDYPAVKVMADDDIKEYFVDLGFDEQNLDWLDLEIFQIPWQVREEIDSLIAANIADIEDLVQTAIEVRVVPNSGREGYLQLGSYEWRTGGSD